MMTNTELEADKLHYLLKITKCKDIGELVGFVIYLLENLRDFQSVKGLLSPLLFELEPDVKEERYNLFIQIHPAYRIDSKEYIQIGNVNKKELSQLEKIFILIPKQPYIKIGR